MLFLLENVLLLVEVDTRNVLGFFCFVLLLNEHYMVSVLLLYSSDIQMIFILNF